MLVTIFGVALGTALGTGAAVLGLQLVLRMIPGARIEQEHEEQQR